MNTQRRFQGLGLFALGALLQACMGDTGKPAYPVYAFKECFNASHPLETYTKSMNYEFFDFGESCIYDTAYLWEAVLAEAGQAGGYQNIRCEIFFAMQVPEHEGRDKDQSDLYCVDVVNKATGGKMSFPIAGETHFEFKASTESERFAYSSFFGTESGASRKCLSNRIVSDYRLPVADKADQRGVSACLRFNHGSVAAEQ